MPLLAEVCDYVENIAITMLLIRYPLHDLGIVRFASLFTIAKLVLYATAVLLALGSLLLPESRRPLSDVNT